MVFEENIIFDDNLIQFAALLSSFSAAQLFNLFLFHPELICNLAICDPFSFIAITLGSNPCTCVYCLDMKRPSSCSFDFLNSTTGGCFVSLSIFF